MTSPLIGIVMGSDSDWPTMQAAARILQDFGVPYEARVVSAHRTPDLRFEYAASARGRGLRATGGGLARMQIPKGTLISFATQPGGIAQDGTDGHSPYTEALAKIIREPGLDIFRFP